MAADLGAIFSQENRNIRPVELVQTGIGIDVDFLEIDAQGTQRLRHLLAQMAVGTPVKLNPYPRARRW